MSALPTSATSCRISNLLNPAPGFLSTPLSTSVEYDIALNRQTRLLKLLHYPEGTILEYPETALGDELVGHLIPIDINNWSNPIDNVAYSLGSPRGAVNQACEVLLDINGEKVLCRKTSSTCNNLYTSSSEQTNEHGSQVKV
jgi:hypothetical protein